MKGLKNYIKIYQTTSLAVKAGIWFTICSFLQRGIQFLITPIVTRLLSTAEYGIYTLFISWVNIITIFASLNLSQGIYYNGLLKNENDEKVYTSSLLGVGTVSTFLVFIAITIFYPGIKMWINFSYSYIMLMFFVVLTQPAFGFWSARQRIKYKYRAVLLITLLNAVLVPTIGIMIFKIYPDLGGYAFILGYVCVNVFINGFIYLKAFKDNKTFYQKEYWKQALNFSIPLIPHYLSLVVLGQSDRIMVNYYEGASAAGIYTLANQIALVMSILITGINSALTPWLYQNIKNRNWEKIRKNTRILALLFMVITSIFVLVAPEILTIVGTEKYLEAKWIIPPIMMATFLTFIYCMFGTILFYYESTKQIAVSSMSGAILNVILNAIFIPRFGYVAAGYTSLVSYFVILIFYYIEMNRCCTKNKISKKMFDIQSIIIMIFLYLIYSVCILALYDMFWIRYIIVFVTVLLLVVFKTRIFKIINEFKAM